MNNDSTHAKSLAHTKWNCKYHIVFAPKYRRKIFFEEKRLAIRDIMVLCQDLKQIKMRIFHRKINICSLSCIYTII